MSVLKELVAKVRDMPPLSKSAYELLELVNTDDYSLGDITRIVETDAALTANVLRVVNRPAFGLGHPVTSLQRAVSFLGDKAVVGIAMKSCASHVYEKPLDGYESAAGEMWGHSLRAAIAARELARATNAANPELAYTCGILHDIGKAALSRFLMGKAPELLAIIDNDETGDFLQAERKALGCDHCMAGETLAEHWKLPAPLPQAIGLHHEPARADEKWRALVYIVHLADAISMMGGSGTGADTLMYSIDEAYQEHLDLSEDKFQELVLDVTIEFEKSSAVMSDTED